MEDRFTVLPGVRLDAGQVQAAASTLAAAMIEGHHGARARLTPAPGGRAVRIEITCAGRIIRRRILEPTKEGHR